MVHRKVLSSVSVVAAIDGIPLSLASNVILVVCEVAQATQWISESHSEGISSRLLHVAF